MRSARSVLGLLVLICTMVAVLAGSQAKQRYYQPQDQAFRPPHQRQGAQRSRRGWTDEAGARLRNEEQLHGKREPLEQQQPHPSEDAPRAGKPDYQKQPRGPADNRYNVPPTRREEQGSAISEFPHCERYVHDPYKLAKCERKAREQQQQQQRLPSETLQTAYPQCQKYVYDSYKLSMCERKAKELTARAANPSSSSAGSTRYPHCDRHAYDPYKLAKCEGQAEAVEQYMSELPPVDQTKSTIHPKCQKYFYDDFKLSLCERKALELDSRPPSSSSEPGPQFYSHCEKYAYDPVKQARCEQMSAQHAQGHVESEFWHCQRVVHDPYKLAMCESKARFWAAEAQTDPRKSGGGAQPEDTIHPQCKHYASDPYKLAKCQNKMKNATPYNY